MIVFGFNSFVSLYTLKFIEKPTYTMTFVEAQCKSRPFQTLKIYFALNFNIGDIL